MTNRLFDALEERFDDIEEVRDITRHGMSGGFSGFIYSSELHEFYDKYEDEIEEYLYEMDFKLHELVDTDEFYSIQELKEKSIWCCVELWAQDKVYTLENELSEEYALANAY